MAALKRAREREKQRLKAEQARMDGSQKVVREVVIPETITLAQLANRMAARGADVVKTLMKLGVMVKINQTIDAYTAELGGQFGRDYCRDRVCKSVDISVVAG